MSENLLTTLSQYLGGEKPIRIKINQFILRTINRLCFEYISKEYTLLTLPLMGFWGFGEIFGEILGKSWGNLGEILGEIL